MCQRNKYKALNLARLLQCLPITELIWEDVSMDFIIRLPKLQGYEVIMVVVDMLSEYAQFILLKQHFIAKAVAKAFMNEVIRLHGFPKTIMSDRDLVSLSNFWKEMF